MQHVASRLGSLNRAVTARPGRHYARPAVCASTPARLHRQQRRCYIPFSERESSAQYALGTDDRVGPVRSIGIVGGGVSGLATAQYIKERFRSSFMPVPNITLYESSDKLGGWMQSERVDLQGLGGEGEDVYIRVERGPRTLAASSAGMVTMDLIYQLGIGSSVRWVSKTAAGAQNRYIYDGGDELRPVPTNLGPLIKDILERGSIILPAAKHILLNFFSTIKLPSPPSKTSLGDVLSHVVGRETVERLVSAFIHGIYAGNVWNLSPRAKGPWSSTVQRLLDNDLSIRELMSSQGATASSAYTWLGKEPSWLRKYQDSFVFYLKEGLGLLSLALESEARMTSSTDVKTETQVQKIELSDDSIVVEYEQAGAIHTDRHDYVVSAVPPYIANDMLDPSPQWQDIQTVTVGVVTLYWHDIKPIPYEGFGYVVSNTTPMEQNPHGALGVIFDSSTRPAQDKNATGQKVTVLLGVEFWEPGLKKGVKLPSESELIKQAEETLQTQLGIDLPPADYSDGNIAKNCIPQPSIEFMQSVSLETNPDVIEWAEDWEGRLFLTGPPVTGPGVHDCINAAWSTAGNVLQAEMRKLDSDPEQNGVSRAELNQAMSQPAGDLIDSVECKMLRMQCDLDVEIQGVDALWPDKSYETLLKQHVEGFLAGREPARRKDMAGAKSGPGSTWTGTPGSKD